MKIIYFLFGKTSEEQLKRFSYIVLTSFILLLIVFIIEVGDIITSSPDISGKGIKNLLVYFESTIKVGALFLILLTIWLTLERIKQTDKQISYLEKQISSLTENNNFNNFYRHREEFIKALSESVVIKLIAQKSDQNFKSLLTTYHSTYFGKRYTEFQLKIRSSVLVDIQDFFDLVKKLDFSNNKLGLEEINTGDLEIFSGKYTFFSYEITLALKELLDENIRKQFKYASLPHAERDTIKSLAYIYFTQKVLIDILEFDGEPLKKYLTGIYVYNFERMCKDYELVNLIIPST